MILRKIVIITAVLAANLISAQRSKEELQQQNAELKRQIAAINSNLAKTKNEAKLSIFSSPLGNLTSCNTSQEVKT